MLAMAGQTQRRASRLWLEQFAKYEEAKQPGVIKAEKFTRCLNKMGIELDKRDDYEALASCFKTSGRGEDESNNNRKERTPELVDYSAFVDFACNVRDSEKLSEIANSLRETISRYDGKKQSSTSYNMAAGLEKLDRHKKGWITSTQFERVLIREDQSPSFHLSAIQVTSLVDRFEYEYEKQQLGIDYMQFAQWLQPLLHLDVKKLHGRVKLLVEDAAAKKGWKLDEIFKAMDDDKNGEIDAVELKEALLEMGLPLTDAQIRCLADEYDVDGDGKIQYNEFLSLFSFSSKKQPEIKKRKGDASDTGSTTDVIKKRKSRPKRNIRNSFSWGITKAFERKQAASGGSKKSITSKRALKSEVSSSSEGNNSGRRSKQRKASRQKSERDDTSSDEEVTNKRPTKKKSRNRKQYSDSSTSSNQKRDLSKSKKARKLPSRRAQLSSTESEQDGDQDKKRDNNVKRKANAAFKSDEEGKARDSSSTEALKRPSKERYDTNTSETSFQDRPSRSRSRKLNSSVRSRPHSRRRPSRRKSPRRRSTSFHGQRRSSSRRPRSVSRPRSQRKSSSRRPRSVSRPRSQRKSSSRRPRSISRSRSLRLRPTRRNKSVHSSDKDSNDNDSSSGLDVEQLRQLRHARGKRAIRRRDTYSDTPEEELDDNNGKSDENSDNDDNEEGWSRSDEEYHSHLKRSLRRAFDFFDLDQTSTIDKRELSHVLRALGHEFTSKELEAEMANADLDRNGQLDFYEFVVFVKKQLAQKTYLLPQQREMEIRQSFQSLDTDKNGALDEQEFEYLIYKVLQVELSVEETDALLDFVDKDADGLISEVEFITFIKKLETLHLKHSGKRGRRKQKEFLDSLDGPSQLAYSAMKKLVRGAPMDLDRNLLMFFGIPSNFRPAISSAATCRTLQGNTMEHVLSFPSPQTIEALALDTRVNDEDSSWFSRNRLDRNSDEYRMLQIAEGVEAQAIVSLKRAAGVPKPFDTREDDVVKRCVHVCLFQEQEEIFGSKAIRRRVNKMKTKGAKVTGAGTVVGNVHEIPVYWHQGEEDVWEFSKKSTKQDKYKFLVRTNAVNDHLYLLVEFIVHLKLSPEEHESKKKSRKKRMEREDSEEDTAMNSETREMVCCWCKIPVRQLLAKRANILRRKEKLWGGTANAPVDIEQDELLRRRTGWRALTNMFSKPSPPLMGIKSVPIDSIAEDLQYFVRKMPPIVIAPFVSLPILAEYMTLVRKTLACVSSSSSVMTCEPALKLLPKIVDDHIALSIFRKAFDAEVAGMKPGEERQLKFQQLVLRMWPSFVHWQERLPPSLLPAIKIPGVTQNSKMPTSAPPTGVSAAVSTTSNEEDPQVASQMRLNLLQTTASGYVASLFESISTNISPHAPHIPFCCSKLRLQDVRVTSTPFHIREVAFQRLL
ncbi:Calmodulin-like protein [Phytophthora citrophthora]|uniref:Calmodulin-like protein n=1 Tax=Phytophthora citrophthora TaxID=4793 RepID=A0AAD9LG90_9STRA|nr:Calmodulin-like protein [Phytophthora citrophthora]